MNERIATRRGGRIVAGLGLVACGALVATAGAGPATRGPVPPEVVIRYPERGQRIAPDSNFVFGSVGRGDVELTIDGARVPVHAEGGFLAWLPVPRPVAGDTASYRIVAVSGPDTVRLSYPIRRPPTSPPPGAERPWLDPDGLEPRVRWVVPGERIEIGLVAERGATITARAGDLRAAARPTGAGRGTLAEYALRLDATEAHAAVCGTGRCGRAVAAADPGRSRDPWALAPVTVDTVPIELVLSAGGAVRVEELRLPIGILDGDELAAKLVEAEDRVNGRSGVVVGRPTPGGPYRWRFAPGSVGRVTGRLGDRLRIGLGSGLDAWVLAEDAEPVLAAGAARTRDARVAPGAGFRGATFRIGVSRAVPTDVRVLGPRTIELALYETLGEPSRIALGVGTGVTDIRWHQEAGPTTRIELDLEWPLWGHRVAWEVGEADAYEGPRSGAPEPGGATVGPRILRLDLRRRPALDRRDPLAGLTIAVDPGHPGGGSYGPTGLFEGDANRAVAERLAGLLRARGAEPVLVRTGADAVGLYDRTRRAREAEAELFVSIHNNALPDGIRPFERTGTSTYYYHPGAAPLARAVQRELVDRLGIGDLGVLWGDLAVAREPWMPAILIEGAFMMIPEQEAALRTPAFQTRYAEGILAGIDAFLERVARGSEEDP